MNDTRCVICGDATRPCSGLEMHGCRQCIQCRMVACYPRPSFAESVDHYKSVPYFRGSHSLEELSVDIATSRAVAASVARQVGRGSRVLEVGASTGGLLSALGEAGLDARGFDVSAEAVESARSLLGVEETVATVEDYCFPPDLSAVIAFHVLEHLVDPSVLLRKSEQALRAGGLLLLEVPDYGAKMREQLGADWPYFMPGEHLQHFDEPAIRRILPMFGFAVVRVVRRGGLGVLQASSGRHMIASQKASPTPRGWRGAVYRGRVAAYKVPGFRHIIRGLNRRIGYDLLRRNAYLQVWAVKTGEGVVECAD